MKSLGVDDWVMEGWTVSSLFDLDTCLTMIWADSRCLWFDCLNVAASGLNINNKWKKSTCVLPSCWPSPLSLPPPPAKSSTSTAGNTPTAPLNSPSQKPSSSWVSRLRMRIMAPSGKDSSSSVCPVYSYSALAKDTAAQEGTFREIKNSTKPLNRLVVKLTAGVSIDGASWQLRFRFSGVAGWVWAGVERRQSLQHAEEAVGGRQLQVFLRDVADLTVAVPGLNRRRCLTIFPTSPKSLEILSFWSDAHLDPVLHVSVVDHLQDLLLLNGQFVRLRRLQTRKWPVLLKLKVIEKRSTHMFIQVYRNPF